MDRVSDKQLQVNNNYNTIYIHLKLWIALLTHNLKLLNIVHYYMPWYTKGGVIDGFGDFLFPASDQSLATNVCHLSAFRARLLSVTQQTRDTEPVVV